MQLAAALRAGITEWPSVDLWSCGIQMLRAADSIGANIAEAHGRDTLPDRRRQLYVARGSTFELEHWIRTAKLRGLTLPDDAEGEGKEISRMLNGLVRRWGRNPRAQP